MLTQNTLIAMALELPGAEPGTAWSEAVAKVGGKALFYWNPQWQAAVFNLDFDTRDMLIEADPETFFTTDHHRNWPCVLARPETVDEGWVRLQLLRAWRRHAPKRLQKQHPDLLKD